MPVIIEAIDDSIDFITDDAPDAIIGTVKDIGDFVQDEIVIPIVDTVEDTVKAMGDDPLRTIVYVAAAASGLCH